MPKILKHKIAKPQIFFLFFFFSPFLFSQTKDSLSIAVDSVKTDSTKISSKEKSIFENVIIIHDYVVFDSKWYQGFLNFDPDWDVSMCKIVNKDGTRWRDWILWWCGIAPYKLEHNNTLLPPNRLLYDDCRYTNSDMYINGTVIIGKRNFLMENKLDENLNKY